MGAVLAKKVHVIEITDPQDIRISHAALVPTAPGPARQHCGTVLLCVDRESNLGDPAALVPVPQSILQS